VQTRILHADATGAVAPGNLADTAPPGGSELNGEHGAGWMWIDVEATETDVADLLALTDRFGLDRLAVRDAVVDVDMPKADDFGSHVLMVLHALKEEAVTTYEIDCFLTEHHLVTIHAAPSPTIDALWNQLQQRPDVARARVDEIAALLADLTTRRLLSVLEAFDNRVEELTHKALSADPHLLEDLTAVRTDLTGVRRVVHPQREALDVLRRSISPVITDAGRRRFSDVFDVASRLADGLDEARAGLAETLDAYRASEARQATEVSKVLTVYAAIMLPLSLIAGFWGMNFANLPWTGKSWGWLVVTAAMAAVALVSLGIFISLGWVRRPSGRRTGQVLGRGLLEATRAPVSLVGTVFEIGTMPLRATTTKLRQVIDDDGNGAGDADRDRPASPHHGSE
jgi:magnesium transporter